MPSTVGQEHVIDQRATKLLQTGRRTADGDHGLVAEIEWMTAAGLQAKCLRVREWYCGYVEVQEGNPNFGVNYADLEGIEVHGGLTFANPGLKGNALDGNGWWFGFDCNHAWDQDDPKSPAYVRVQCESLAKQLTFDHRASRMADAAEEAVQEDHLRFGPQWEQDPPPKTPPPQITHRLRFRCGASLAVIPSQTYPMYVLSFTEMGLKVIDTDNLDKALHEAPRRLLKFIEDLASELRAMLATSPSPLVTE